MSVCIVQCGLNKILFIWYLYCSLCCHRAQKKKIKLTITYIHCTPSNTCHSHSPVLCHAARSSSNIFYICFHIAKHFDENETAAKIPVGSLKNDPFCHPHFSYAYGLHILIELNRISRSHKTTYILPMQRTDPHKKKYAAPNSNHFMSTHIAYSLFLYVYIIKFLDLPDDLTQIIVWRERYRRACIVQQPNTTIFASKCVNHRFVCWKILLSIGIVLVMVTYVCAQKLYTYTQKGAHFCYYNCYLFGFNIIKAPNDNVYGVV